jgi:hypothetical protein
MSVHTITHTHTHNLSEFTRHETVSELEGYKNRRSCYCSCALIGVFLGLNEGLTKVW